jgi:class 3 adenylate cyclase/tetratricopeptide (TPR) repeat protein
MICPECATSNRDKAIFCKRCSRLLLDTCPNCHQDIPEDAYYCDHCAFPLKTEVRRDWPIPAFISRPLSSGPPDPATQPGRSPGQTPPTSGYSPVAPPDSQVSRATEVPTTLQRYIPAELLQKMETARSDGTMVGERRVVTTLFCDVKGSTAAADQLDPEEWTEIINGAFEHMIGPVYQYEGTVARLMGDAILAFFGAPIGHEDDPQRAVLAGLDIVAGIGPYRKVIKHKWGIDINVRVGINTGRVVVGTVGSDLRMEYTAMGDAINLAARMEQAAEPGTILIAETTYKLVEHLFKTQDMGGISVKGKDEPVPAYRVLGRRSSSHSRRGIDGLASNMIGRDLEFSTLRDTIDSVQQGVGQIVCVIGDAGLGKSRLVRELKQSTKSTQSPNSDLQWIETASLSYETTQPYGLFQRLIRRLNDIGPADSITVLREKVTSLTTGFEGGEDRRILRVFEALFDLEPSTGDPRLEGEAFRRELFQVIPELWRMRFSEVPSVIVFEDLHWSDPVSIDLLLHLLPLTAEIPLLLICAFRPERNAPAWRVKTFADDEFRHRYTEVALRPLSDMQVNELVDDLLEIADLPDLLRERILERSGGNPFFVEEVVRGLIDSGAVASEEAMVDNKPQVYWRATGDSQRVEIPDNLQALLAARIDRLEEETRHTLQLASVIGRTFSQRVLQSIGNNGHALKVERELGLLERLKIIREAARLPEVEYKFSNPLTQEVAYATILLRQRREFHNKVGQAMETLFPERLAEMAPRLASHFREGGSDGRAAHYFTMAGDTAYRLFALTEAIRHYSQALELTEKDSAKSEELVHLFSRRGRAMELANIYSDAIENYAEMERVADEREDDALKLAALLARTIVHTTFSPVFDPKIGLPLAEEALNLAQQQEDFAAQAKVLWSLMLVHAYALGENATGTKYGRQALELAREHNLTDQLPYILNDLGRIMAFDNRIIEGLPLVAEAQPMFEKSGNLPLLSDNLSANSLLSYFAGDMKTARESAEEALRVSRSINNQIGIEDNIWRACMIYAEQGELGRAVHGLESVIDATEGIQPQTWPYLAYIYAELGAADEVLGRYEAIFERASLSGPFFRDIYAAQLSRLLLELDDLDKAQDVFEEYALAAEPSDISTLNLWSFLAQAELLYTQEEYEEVVKLLDGSIARMEEVKLAWFKGDLLLLQARALLALEPPQTDKALIVLEKAMEFTRDSGIKRVAWKVMSLLSELVDEDEAQVLRNEAREIVEWIADGIENPDLRQSFLDKSQVHQVIEVG